MSKPGRQLVIECKWGAPADRNDLTDIDVAACPFCGSSAVEVEVLQVTQNTYYVTCHACDADGPTSKGARAAVTLWNLRILKGVSCGD